MSAYSAATLPHPTSSTNASTSSYSTSKTTEGKPIATSSYSSTSKSTTTSSSTSSSSSPPPSSSSTTSGNGDSTSRNAAMKNRIISHMNADHVQSLTLFLRHYCGVPQTMAETDPKLADITLEHMVIESGAGRNLIPIDPPMKAFSESRERMVSMHRDSMRGLDLSEVVIDEFAAPRKWWQIGLFVVCCWCYATFLLGEKLLPESGSWAAKGWSLGGLAPGLARTAYRAGWLVWPFMVVVHSVEAGILAKTRLRRHQVPVGGKVWWLWVGSTFVSGVGTFNRFDDFVREKEAEMKSKSGKH